MMLAEDPRPPYVQVADYLRGLIASGERAPGAKLPSARELAKQFGFAEMTVNAGMRVLRDEGLTMTTPGRGTFVRQDAKVAAPAPETRVLVEQLASRVEELTERVAVLEERLTASQE